MLRAPMEGGGKWAKFWTNGNIEKNILSSKIVLPKIAVT